MKTIRKILTYIVMVMVLVSNISYSVAEWEGVAISTVEVKDSKNITITLDKELETSTLTSEEVKVMHDVTIEKAELDIADAKKVVLTLASELSRNTTYNLISLVWVDGSMDFETASDLSWEIMNTWSEGIKSINIIDEKTIEVMYHEAITSNEVELKLLEDMNIESITPDSTVIFSVTTLWELEKENNYIFMLLAGSTPSGEEAVIEYGIFDFATGADIPVASSENEAEVVEIQETANIEDTSTETTTADTINISDEDNNQEAAINTMETGSQDSAMEWEDIELNSAAEWDENLILEKNIDEVAAEATEVPETGAATNATILITLGLAGMAMFRRKKA